jgi:glycyl-tRNA synthetase beta chain
MSTQNLLVELFVEELPPRALKKLGEAFSKELFEQLKVRGHIGDSSVRTSFATPRRLAAHITSVAEKAQDKEIREKLMLVAVAIKDGKPTDALRKRLAKIGRERLADLWPNAVDGPDSLVIQNDGKAEAVYLKGIAAGGHLGVGLEFALEEAIRKLPIPKVMTYQLETDCELPGWSSVNFVRPAHSLMALHGKTVVAVKALGLTAGNSTQGHRFEAKADKITVKSADDYEEELLKQGCVITSFAKRKTEIAKQLAAAAAKVGGGAKPIEDDALLDEVTALVEKPNVLICEFEKQFLEVPQECLILTMKANQKYFPLLDAKGKLTNKFLVVSNISPSDTSAVVGGNERVVRPRLADAKFFFDKDRKTSLTDRVAGLDKVVYHNKLGTQGQRVERVRAMAREIGKQLGGEALAKQADQTAQLAKTDLLTDMVGEFPELQGIMGGYYALNDGLSKDVANAIEDHYKPRFAGDELPRNQIGLVVALADKLETLVGMFGIGNLPTGDKDPFALRRHALGVIRMLTEGHINLEMNWLLHTAADPFGKSISTDRTELVEQISDFIFDRLAGSLREQNYSAQEVESVLALRPQRLGDVSKRLDAVRAFAALPEAPALAAANKRISNILKKAQDVDPHVSEVLLKVPAEKALYASLKEVVPKADAQFKAGDYTASLKTLAALREPVDTFFEGVMVNAEELDLRLNRQGLLKALHNAMNQVADLSRLAS